MKLSYKAITKDSKIVQGLIEANGVDEAAAYLKERELVPIQIKKRQETSFLKFLPFFKKVKSSDIILFTRQVSSMLVSGLTLPRSLEIFKDQIQNQNITEVVNYIITDIEGGKSFSLAIAKYPTVFSPIYVSLVKAGEQSGLLDKVLSRLADNLEKQDKLKSTIRSALMYPIIVIILMIVVIFIMMIFVIPQLTVLYANLNVPLPLPTQIIVSFSHFIVIFWPVVIAIVVGTIFLYRRWHATLGGRMVIDDLLLKLPIFGKLIQETTLAEFSRTFGLLVGTGTLVVDALFQTADTLGNIHYKNAVKEIAKQVEKGITIGDAMSLYSLFPPIIIQLVRVGEQTGKIDESLVSASDYFEREVDQTVKTLTTAMEPFIMIVLGIGVSFLIISIITPIYSLISNIQ
jgi:type II secretory pathway component PulF